MNEIEDEEIYEEVNDGTKKEEFKLEKNNTYGSYTFSHVKKINSSSTINKKYAVYFFVAMTGILLMLALLVSSAIAWHKISQIESELIVNVESSIETQNKGIELLSHKIDKTTNVLNETAKLLNQHFQVLQNNIENITQLFTGVLSSPPIFRANSCANVLLLFPSAPSDYYWIRSSNGFAVRVYCDMTISCGGITGGWTRIARLDMRDNSSQCPCDLQEHTDSNDIRTCLVTHTTASHCTCSAPITLPTDALSYSRVCGRIKGYQFGTPDAFHYTNPNCDRNIFYVDGISFTHGNPRQHIWTFAAGVSENENHQGRCPCSNGPSPPLFVGDDYFCDTGNKESADFNRYLYEDPLWDGINCSNSTCCSFNNPPWFYKQLPEHTTDDIEMKICRDQPAADENIAIELIELYIS